MDENTNVDVFEEIEENYPRSFEYVKSQMNVRIRATHSFDAGITTT